jgi:hypothetical protein
MNTVGEKLITPVQLSAEDVLYLETLYAHDFAAFGY